MLSSLTGKKTIGIIETSLKAISFRTSGSVVEYRLAKARVAGSNPVSCSRYVPRNLITGSGVFRYKRSNLPI